MNGAWRKVGKRAAGSRLLALAGALVAVLAAMPGVLAAPAGGEVQRQALLQQMLADPGNVEVALQYARLSAAAGDLEGAVSTLERLRIFAPGVARLDFELGVLYYRLGAYQLAATYFTDARDARDATPRIKAQATAYIAQAERQTAADRTFATVVFGARYQSNANGGAGSPFVDLNGVPFQLNPAAMADPDANGFAAANLHVSHDLASQGDRFDADLGLYGSLYGKHNELNTLAGELKAGPVFNLERFSIAHSTLGLYGIMGGVALRGDPYFYTAGIGGVLTTQLDPATIAKGRLEYRYEQFFNSALRPSVAGMTGARLRATGEIRHQLDAGTALYASLYGERKNAIFGTNADWEAGAVVGTVLSFSGPFANANGPWSLDLSLGVAQRQFDVNDPVVSPAARHDTEAFVQGALTVPVAESWSAIATVGYRRQVSNYGLYTFDNASASLAMLKSF
jgi:tetratricopeptide (TPR) repeat protein